MGSPAINNYVCVKYAAMLINAVSVCRDRQINNVVYENNVVVYESSVTVPFCLRKISGLRCRCCSIVAIIPSL